jgi:hypothetical protein
MEQTEGLGKPDENAKLDFDGRIAEQGEMKNAPGLGLIEDNSQGVNGVVNRLR